MPVSFKLKTIFPLAESFIATSDDNKIYSWGWNEHGNLALGHKEDRLEPSRVDFDLQESQRIAGSGAYWLIY